MRPTAEAYTNAEPFLREMHKWRARLTTQQMSTLKGQALAGDIEGARRGMYRLLHGEDYWNDADRAYT